MEYFDIVDENGNPTGEKVEREKAHALGIPHRTAHVWLYRIQNDKVQLLLQKRSLNKDSFPGQYDISTAGHIPAGSSFLESAIREAKEELGLVLEKEKMIVLGDRKNISNSIFHHHPFHDNEYTRVYLYYCDFEVNQFIIQKEEIESLKWEDFALIYKAVKNKDKNYCVVLTELEMIKTYLKL